MLKRMRWRVIWMSMTAFFAVILLVLLLVNSISYIVITKHVDNTILSVLAFEQAEQEHREAGNRDPHQFMELPDREANFMTRFFTVRYDEEGEHPFISTDYIAAVDADEALSYAGRALEGGREKGYLDVYRFNVYTTAKGKAVIFLNTKRELEQMASLLLISSLVACGSLILVFVIVWFLSANAIRPFVKNVENQKQFITDAGHELKTPLTSITTSTEILEMEYGDNEWTDNIRTQTKRMSKLVGELITLSRLDEAGSVLHKESFSLSDAAWEIAETLQPQAKANGKTIDISIQDEVTYNGDKSQIQKMLSVLLDNAIRYSAEQGTIAFSLRKEKKITISVSNNCVFDNPPDLSRLFERFYRPDSSRNVQTGGTGIGLSIAKAVAEKHEGKIEAKLLDGNTIIFEVTL
ncbi:MAG: GHKL domain-containing protein [Lachnospiraceae bacterium]|nr:GHKL domain-containing protein [Lachnospiraceae bacterium]